MDHFRPTGRQLAAARTLAGMTQPELAAKANISVATLKRMEGMDGPVAGMPNNVIALCRALEEAGVEFIPPDDSGAGVRLKTPDPADDLGAADGQ